MTLKRGQRLRVRLYLYDEAPRIGCGYRDILLAVGSKWLRLTDPYTGASQRVRRSKFTLRLYGGGLSNG